VANGERAEVVDMTEARGALIREDGQSGTHFYGFSVRLEPNWRSPFGSRDVRGRPPAEYCRRNDGSVAKYAWGAVVQLHGPDDLLGPGRSISPAFGFAVTGPEAYNLFSIGTLAGPVNPSSPYDNERQYRLSEADLRPGKWVDFILEIRWAGDASGHIRAWRRDEEDSDFAPVQFIQVYPTRGASPVTTLQGPTLQYVGGVQNIQPHYWKHGFYRARCPGVTNTLWIDGMTRGSSYAAVRNSAF
jgi:hypothetical protein